jgi:hypothetical protein
MASQLALFAIVTGVALVLTGVGFLVLAAAGAVRESGAPQPAGATGREALAS